jgi:copper chaperone CopZ
MLLVVVCLCYTQRASAEDSVKSQGKFRVFGLFSPDREQDLRQVMEKLPDVTLVDVDFSTGEATFEFDIKKVFGSPTPEQIPERLNHQLRSVSNSTFGVKPLCTIPRDKLEMIEIPVYGLDCKACSFACYKMLAETEGVEYAVASFKEQRAKVLIDPTKTNRAALEKLMKEREVSLEPAKVIVVP